MPKTKRDMIKRKFGYIWVNLDRSMGYMVELKAEFDAVAGLTGQEERYEEIVNELAETSPHAKFALLMHHLLTICLMVQEHLQTFAETAWGYTPEDITTWTNTGQDYREKENEE